MSLHLFYFTTFTFTMIHLFNPLKSGRYVVIIRRVRTLSSMGGAEKMLRVLEKGQILLIADDSKIQKTVERGLENEGYEVFIAQTEDQALFQLYDEEPVCIVIDLKMRSSVGMHTFDKLMKHEEWKIIPKIVLSEDTDIIKYLDNFDLTFVESVAEPVKPLILSRRVDSIVLKRSNSVELGKCIGKSKSTDQIISEAESTIQTQQTKIEKLDKEISNIVVKDALTNLNNRKSSMQRIEEEIARHDRNGLHFSLILCDVDNLHNVNAKYGRGAGDVVIRKASELVIHGKRQQDFAARWEGGEFLLLLPDTDLEGAIIFAERARKRVENHTFRVDETHFSISMTFGVICYDKTMPSDLFVTLVDRALKKGKDKGRNKVVTADTL